MKKIRKKAFLMAMVVSLGFLSSALMVSSTYATYYSDVSDTEALEDITMYADAAERCLSSSKSNGFVYPLSYRSEGVDKSALLYFSMNNDSLFEHKAGKDDSNTLYSAVLESKTSKGYDNGSLYCDELNIFPTLFKKLGIYDDNHLSQLFCNGSEPGIFEVTAGYGLTKPFAAKYDNDKDGEKDWPEGLPDPENGADCGANLALFLDYMRNRPNETIEGSGNGRHDYPFAIHFKLSDDAADYFSDYMRDYLGKWGDLDAKTKSGMNYWTYYKTFEVGCAEITSGQLEKPAASSDNMIGIYDAKSGNVYYHSLSKINQSNKLYYYVINKEQLTCKELAGKLGADIENGGVDENKIDRLAVRTNQDAIKGCIDEYFKAHDEYSDYSGKYTTLVVAGTNFVRLAGNVLDGVENKSSLYPSDALIFNNKPALDQFSADLSEYLDQITAGVDGSAVYANNVFFSLKSAIDDIIANTSFEYDGKVSETTATSEQISAARNLLSQASSEVDRVEKLSRDLTNTLIDDYPANPYTEGDYDSLRGKIWDIKDGVVICPGLEDMTKDIGNMGLVNAPEIDASYDPNNYKSSSGGGTWSEEDGDPCYNSGIEGMSWVLCPTINNTAEAVDGIDALLDSWLAVDADLYGNGSDAYKAWSSFRTIANVFMIIILLAIIVSQITGYGIDNYGIKKMLPRLIVMSIMINLSFLICQLAIDVSNILGGGLNQLFKGLGHSISSGFTPGKMISGLVAGLFGALAGAGAVSGVAISVIGIAAGGGGVMLVLSLVIALITALVAVLMFFISLGARFIIIIVFTALAPVAFACYVLPNTQSLFKKWWDIFKTALLVYPICGALYGMSFVVRGIVFGGGKLHFWMAIMAIIAPFLPFLLLPGLIKGALSTLGRLGGTLAMVGAGVKRGISKGNTALQGTDAYKSQQEMAQRNLNARRAGLKWDRKTRSLAKDENGNYIQNENIGRLGRFVRGGDSGMAAARSRFLRDEKAKIDEQNLMGAGFAAGLAGVAMRADEQRDANAEAMLAYDKATFADADGNTHTVNSGSIDSVAAYHAASLRKYNEATTDDERANALSEIRASQKMLSKTDAGRGMVNQNLTDAVIGGNESGARAAATHLQNNYGDVYKAKNRGAHKLISDLSGGTEMSKMREDIGNGTYELAGASKYDQSTLVGADDMALKSMANAVSRIEAKRANGETVSESEQQQFDQIRNTARKAVEMYDSGRLSIKPEALEHVEKIAGQKAQRVSGGDSGASDGGTDGSGSTSSGGDSSSETHVDVSTTSPSNNSSESHSVNSMSGGIRSDDYIDKRINSANHSAPGVAAMRGGETTIRGEALGSDGVLNIEHENGGGRGPMTTRPVDSSIFDVSRNQVTDSGIVIANEEQTKYFDSREARNARPEAVKKDFSKIIRNINSGNQGNS